MGASLNIYPGVGVAYLSPSPGLSMVAKGVMVNIMCQLDKGHEVPRDGPIIIVGIS